MKPTGDEKLDYIEDYFSDMEGYIIRKNFYGKDVPSNSIQIEGPNFFRFSWCVSWPAPQVSCALIRPVVIVLKHLESIVSE